MFVRLLMLRNTIPFTMAFLATTAFLVAPSTGQTLTWLGTLGGEWSYACGVSADGTVVAGESETTDGSRRAFRWTRSGGMQDLGTFGGLWSYATALTPDGVVLIGTAQRADGLWRAFRWTAATGLLELYAPEQSSAAFGISADGSIVVGGFQQGTDVFRAVRWLPSGMPEVIHTPDGWGLLNTCAFGVSFNGDIVVGLSEWQGSPDPFTSAFLWMPSSGLQRIGDFSAPTSYAFAVPADGSTVVGESIGVESGVKAFCWTRETGVVHLDTPFGFSDGSALAISLDGSVIVGDVSNPSEGTHAARWTALGVDDLNVTYSLLLRDGSILSTAAGVSADGRFIVGGGYNAATGGWEAFLLDTAARHAIRGKLYLSDYIGDITRVPVHVELRQNNQVMLRDTIYIDEAGGFAITGLENGIYDVRFKSSHWLSSLVRELIVAGADTVGVQASLTNGDVDGDNEVTLFDFGELVAAFGSVPGDENWNPDADLDGDEEVTLADFGILVRNFGDIGDE